MTFKVLEGRTYIVSLKVVFCRGCTKVADISKTVRYKHGVHEASYDKNLVVLLLFYYQRKIINTLIAISEIKRKNELLLYTIMIYVCSHKKVKVEFKFLT